MASSACAEASRFKHLLHGIVARERCLPLQPSHIHACACAHTHTHMHTHTHCHLIVYFFSVSLKQYNVNHFQILMEKCFEAKSLYAGSLLCRQCLIQRIAYLQILAAG